MSEKLNQLSNAAFGGGQRQRPKQKQQSDGPKIAPATVAFLAKLEGDEDAVRSTLQLAVQADPHLGFWALAYACRIVKDIELRKSLIETLGHMGRYPELHQHVTMILLDLAGRETSPEMFAAIERAWDSYEKSPQDIMLNFGIAVVPEIENYFLKPDAVDSRSVGSPSGHNQRRPVGRKPRSGAVRAAAAVESCSHASSAFDQPLEKNGRQNGTCVSTKHRSQTSKKQHVSAETKLEPGRGADAFAGSLTNSEAAEQLQLRAD